MRVAGSEAAPVDIRATNLSVYGCGFEGSDGGGIVLGPAGSVRATNVVAASNHPSDFLGPAGGVGWKDSSHNVSSDASAPGASALTETPVRPSSLARERVTLTTAALDA